MLRNLSRGAAPAQNVDGRHCTIGYPSEYFRSNLYSLLNHLKKRLPHSSARSRARTTPPVSTQQRVQVTAHHGRGPVLSQLGAVRGAEVISAGYCGDLHVLRGFISGLSEVFISPLLSPSLALEHRPVRVLSESRSRPLKACCASEL
ncbi:hypothetical protein NDU88_002320 [Pleurodeles waltl]|uniref:Uncharacterized protein n=1 Tax=Pleurodeles waltl TaxID=8319 RepID=A0AAV7KVB9_PLEWA|nr:hypothetical protein NDU88_002320 [Pleurodeles waltl]